MKIQRKANVSYMIDIILSGWNTPFPLALRPVKRWVLVMGLDLWSPQIESQVQLITQAGRYDNTKTNKPLNRDNWGFSKLLSRETEGQTLTVTTNRKLISSNLGPLIS